MSINRSYVFDKNENIDKMLKGLGIADDKVEKMLAVKPKLDICLDGKSLCICSSHGDVKTENKLILGEFSTYKLMSGAELEVCLTLEGNIAKGQLRRGDKTGSVTINISPEELIETFEIGGLTAKRCYKKA